MQETQKKQYTLRVKELLSKFGINQSDFLEMSVTEGDKNFKFKDSESIIMVETSHDVS